MINAMETLEKYFTFSHPCRISIEMTNNCNLRCIHCYHPNHFPYELETQMIVNAVEQFRDLGVISVALTGGEIFLYRDFKDVIKSLKRMNLEIELLSNATVITSDMVSFLEDQGVNTIQISIYGANESTYDKVTNTKNMFTKHLSSLESLSTSSMSVTSSIIMMKQNFNEREQMRKICTQYGFSIMYGMRILSDRNNQRRIDCELSNDQKNQLANEINELNAEQTINSSFIMLEDKDEILSMHPCGAGFLQFNITAQGDVTPCTGYHKILGNIYDERVTDIINNELSTSIKQTLRKDIKKCTQCSDVQYCSYCPGIIYQEHGDNLDFEDSSLCTETNHVKYADKRFINC